MSTRIYIVTTPNKVKLIEAVSPGQAIMHVAKQSIEVRLASAKDVAEHMIDKCTRVEKVGEKQDPPITEME